jgi:flagellin-like hook-associated protein FlgL
MFTFSPLQITLASSISDVQKEIILTQNQLSSGKKTLNAGEYGIVTRLSSQASSFDTAVKNIAAASNVVTVGQTTLTSMSAIATQLKDLATQGSSSGLDTSDRDSMAATFASLYDQLTTLTTAASINGNNVIDGVTDLTVLYNPDEAATTFTNVDVAADTLLTTISAAVADNLTFTAAICATLVTELTTYLDSISTAQGNLTAISVALDAYTSGAKGVSSALNATVGSIQDIDSTALQTKLQSLNNQQSIDYYLVSQMNTASAAVLAIFR